MRNKTIIGAIVISMLYGIAAIPAAMLVTKLPQPIVMVITSSIYFTLACLYCCNTQSNLNEITIDKNIIIPALVLGVLCTWLPNVIYYNILNDKNTTLVSAISSIYPIWTLVFSYIFLSNTKITPSLIIGLILIIMGVIKISKH